MIRLVLSALILLGLYYAFVGGGAILSNLQNGNMALAIRGLTKAELDARILDHYERVILTDVSDLSADSIKTTITDLNDDGDTDIIAIVESESTCGTGGCIASIFVEDEFGELVAIPFRYAVEGIEVLGSITQGMRDLRINGSAAHTLIWNGTTYVPEQI